MIFALSHPSALNLDEEEDIFLTQRRKKEKSNALWNWKMKI